MGVALTPDPSALWSSAFIAAPTTQPLTPEDPSTCGPFRLLGRIGTGGMGVVYLGEGADGELVAVKRVRLEHADQPHFRERLRQEVAAMRQLKRGFTARIVAADVLGTPQWLAMEYMPGDSLHRVVSAGNVLDDSQVRALAGVLASALHEIHRAGFAHHDVKPANIILTAAGPRLIDFGISGLIDSAYDGENPWIMGSPAWMAPEQLKGDRGTSAASDVHGWADVVYYAATGSNPFGKGSASEVAQRIQQGHGPDLSDLPESLADLRPLLVAALSSNPRERPTTADIRAALFPSPTAIGVHQSTPKTETSSEDAGGETRAAAATSTNDLDTRGRWMGALLAAAVAAIVVVLGMGTLWTLATKSGGATDAGGASAASAEPTVNKAPESPSVETTSTSAQVYAPRAQESTAARPGQVSASASPAATADPSGDLGDPVDVVNAAAVQSNIESEILRVVDGASVVVDCPTNVRSRVGATFTCAAVVNGQRASISVTQTGASGTVRFESAQAFLFQDKAQRAVNDYVTENVPGTWTTVCAMPGVQGGVYVATPNTTFTCDVTGTTAAGERKSGQATVTVDDNQGNVSIQVN